MRYYSIRQATVQKATKVLSGAAARKKSRALEREQQAAQWEAQQTELASLRKAQAMHDAAAASTLSGAEITSTVANVLKSIADNVAQRDEVEAQEAVHAAQAAKAAQAAARANAERTIAQAIAQARQERAAKEVEAEEFAELEAQAAAEAAAEATKAAEEQGQQLAVLEHAAAEAKRQLAAAKDAALEREWELQVRKELIFAQNSTGCSPSRSYHAG